MKKDLDFKLVVWLLVTAFIISAPGSVYSMDTIRSKAQWVKTKASRVKEKTLDRLVKRYRDTQELRRKKAEGTETPVELKTLQRRMKSIKIAAVVIGITLATIAAIAGGTLAYREYRKRERGMLAEEEALYNKVRAATSSNFLEPMETRTSNLKEIRNALERGVNIDTLGENDWTPLHIAAIRGDSEVARLLINKGANVHAKDDLGLTPFFWAIFRGNADVLRVLIGADVDFKFDDNALHDAAKNDHAGIARILIERDADVNAKSDTGQTPLHVFVSKGRWAITQFLVESGADVNAKDDKGWTPLHEATSKGYSWIAPFLVERGADPYRRDNNGKTPLDVSETPAVREVVEQAVARREMRVANPALMGLPEEVRMRIGGKVGVETPWKP